MALHIARKLKFEGPVPSLQFRVTIQLPFEQDEKTLPLDLSSMLGNSYQKWNDPSLVSKQGLHLSSQQADANVLNPFLSQDCQYLIVLHSAVMC